MDGERTARFGLPLLQAGQAQKEIDHNEALALLDIAVQAGVTEIGLNTPPGSPAVGACWIVGTAPSGAWSGQAGAIAGWTTGGWRFVPPRIGLTAWSLADQMPARYDADGWHRGRIDGARVRIDGLPIIGPRAAAIPTPAGGATVDAEARAAITAILATLRAHGLIAT